MILLEKLRRLEYLDYLIRHQVHGSPGGNSGKNRGIAQYIVRVSSGIQILWSQDYL